MNFSKWKATVINVIWQHASRTYDIKLHNKRADCELCSVLVSAMFETRRDITPGDTTVTSLWHYCDTTVTPLWHLWRMWCLQQRLAPWQETKWHTECNLRRHGRPQKRTMHLQARGHARDKPPDSGRCTCNNLLTLRRETETKTQRERLREKQKRETELHNREREVKNRGKTITEKAGREREREGWGWKNVPTQHQEEREEKRNCFTRTPIIFFVCPCRH